MGIINWNEESIESLVEEVIEKRYSKHFNHLIVGLADTMYEYFYKALGNEWTKVVPQDAFFTCLKLQKIVNLPTDAQLCVTNLVNDDCPVLVRPTGDGELTLTGIVLPKLLVAGEDIYLDGEEDKKVFADDMYKLAKFTRLVKKLRQELTAALIQSETPEIAIARYPWLKKCMKYSWFEANKNQQDNINKLKDNLDNYLQ